MKQHQYNSNMPPLDLNGLDEGYAIRIEYDSNGNPRRIWKERQNNGCFGFFAIIAFLVIGGAVVIFWL